MHQNSYDIVERFVQSRMDPKVPTRVLDVGSYNVNGTYRPLFAVPGWTYVGIDVSAGPNVDVVVDGEYKWEAVQDGAADVVICGQVMEHVKEPWSFARALGRVCRPGGLVCVVAPWTIAVHRYPLDCWRVLPDGMEHIMGEYGKFDKVGCSISCDDTWYVGRRLP